MDILYPVKSRNIDGTQQPVTRPLTISSKFGPRGSGFHNGIDIPVPVGSYLQAPFDGTLSISVNAQGGNQVVVTSTNGNNRFGFAHLKNLDIANDLIRSVDGKKVRKGTIIGLSGNTGNSTGPHLHFTYTVNDEKKDPASLTYSFNEPILQNPNSEPIRLPLLKFPNFSVIVILLLILLAYVYTKKREGQGALLAT